MVQHGKRPFDKLKCSIVGLFLPSIDGCKLAFIRAILKEEKKAFKSSEIVVMDVPNYAEISVKNLYDDAMADPEVAAYLPTKE